MMKKQTIKYLLNIGLILLCTVLVYFTALRGNIHGILESLRDIKPIYLSICLIMVFLCHVATGAVLYIFTKQNKSDYKLRHGIINSMVASFFHGITPSASGGQFAQMYVFRKQGVKSGDAVSVLWMEFIIYQSTMVLYGLVLILCFFNRFYEKLSSVFVFVILGFIINAAVIVFLYAIGLSNRLHNFLTTNGVNLLAKMHIIKNPEAAKNAVEIKVDAFSKECAKLKTKKKLIIQATFLSFARLSLNYLMPFVIFAALGEKADWHLMLDCLAMGSFVSVASALIPIPGASGGAEALFIMMFSNLFTNIIATTAVVIWRFFSYYLVLAIGGICFIYVKVKK